MESPQNGDYRIKVLGWDSNDDFAIYTNQPQNVRNLMAEVDPETYVDYCLERFDGTWDCACRDVGMIKTVACDNHSLGTS